MIRARVSLPLYMPHHSESDLLGCGRKLRLLLFIIHTHNMMYVCTYMRCSWAYCTMIMALSAGASVRDREVDQGRPCATPKLSAILRMYGVIMYLYLLIITKNSISEIRCYR